MRKTFYNIYSLGHKLSNSFQFEMKRRNLHDERLLTNWKQIFEDFADRMQPCKILFSGVNNNGLIQKILYVSTEDRQFATEFLFYKQRLLERLNQYFGIHKSIFKDIKIKVAI